MRNLKPALRSLAKTPVPTLVVVVTLALAIGANTALFSVVSGVLLRPLGYGDDSRLVVLWATPAEGADLFRLSPADYRDVRDEVEAFAGQAALYRSIGSTLTALAEPQRVGSLTVTPRLFSVLDARPSVGTFFNDADSRPGIPSKVVLTDASWTRRFGADPSIVGTTIELDGQPRTVVGVTQPGFQFPPGQADVEMYFPMTLSDRILLDRSHRMFDSVARLADGATLESANAELAAFAAGLAVEYGDTNAGWSLTARTLREEVLGDVATTLWVLAGAVFLVLLIACANVANILVARSAASGREYAVRAALGARALDLLARALTESLVLGLLGGLAGLPLAYGAVAALRSVIPDSIPRTGAIAVDGSVLTAAALLSIGSALVFGLLTALPGLKPDVAELLKPAAAGAGGGPTGGRRLREAMVVVQVALAVVLLVAAGLMVRSFSQLSEVDPGFRRQGVVSVAVQLPGTSHNRTEWQVFYERLVDRVREQPGVVAAGAVSDLPMSDIGLGFEMEFTVEGLDALSPSARPNAEFRLTIPGYFDAMGMPIVKGRAFNRTDANRKVPVAIVSETLVRRYFQGVDPIGRRIRTDMLNEVEVLGIVADIRHGGLQSKYESEMYLPYGRIATSEMHVVVQSSLAPDAAVASVRGVLRELDPRLVPSEVVVISELLWKSVAQPRFNTALLSGLALCAALLAVLGTWGIVAYAVSRRNHEIGVRIALGADSAATMTLIVRQALTIVGVGAVVGILGALGASQLLSELLFDVRPTDPATYAAVLAAAIAVGLLASWLPARRATRIDPVVALRGE